MSSVMAGDGKQFNTINPSGRTTRNDNNMKAQFYTATPKSLAPEAAADLTSSKRIALKPIHQTLGQSRMSRTPNKNDYSTIGSQFNN